MPRKKSRIRKLYLQSRSALNLKPLPEEQLGVVGPDTYDAADWIRELTDGRLAPVDLLEDYPLEIINQGRTNRCGPCAGTSGMQILMQKTLGKGAAKRLSVNDLYRFSRRTDKDSGVFMRDLMAGMAKRGALPDHMWPLDHRFNAVPRDLEDTGKLDPIRYRIRGGYWRVRSASDCAHILSTERIPIWIGATLYKKSSENAHHSGIFELPDSRDTVIGGHAMLMVGWLRLWGQMHFILVNSWGTSSGKNGLFLMPEAYIREGYCNDMWTVAKDLF